jgi:hypothetical protein
MTEESANETKSSFAGLFFVQIQAQWRHRLTLLAILSILILTYFFNKKEDFMAKFCSQCGRPLQEGEICTCRQQGVNLNQGTDTDTEKQAYEQPAVTQEQTQTQEIPNQTQQFQTQQFQNQQFQNQQFQNQQFQNQQFQNQQFNGNPYQNNMGNMPYGANMQNQYSEFGNKIKQSGNNIFKDIIDLFKNPIGTTARIANEDNIVAPLTMVIFNIAVVFIFSVLCMIIVRVNVGEYNSWLSIPYVRIVIGLTLLSAMFDFGLAGIMLLSQKVFFREQTSFAKTLTVVGTKVMLDSVFLVVGILLAFVSAPFGSVVYCVGMIFTALMMIMSYQKVCTLSDVKKFYSYLVTVVIMAIVMGIIYLLIAFSIADSLRSIWGYLF